ncbi:MAG: TIGR04338 family metallohydrolase [Mycobacterium sp.]|nr:TIGR04338 family metallohydrolase [Mycobacterium sp.]
MTVRDTQRAQVYAAEDFVRTLFDRAAQHSSRAIDFFGTPLTLPPEARFASVEAVGDYVQKVLMMPAVRERWAPGELAVRPRRGLTAAHYENAGGSAVIAVPDRGERWAMRELVILHEIAHHLCPAQPAHGGEFTSTFCDLAGIVMGPEVGHVLQVVYAKEGVRLR